MEGDRQKKSRHPATMIISIHSLRMEGDRLTACKLLPEPGISIHSLRMEGDATISQNPGTIFIFQSTPSAWRETSDSYPYLDVSTYISIHSLRMEGDSHNITPPVELCHFNPLPPHGGRPPEEKPTPCNNDYFNPLPPHGGRQTHSVQTLAGTGNFNPLPPHGGRRDDFTKSRYDFYISIHSLRMEGDMLF